VNAAPATSRLNGRQAAFRLITTPKTAVEFPPRPSTRPRSARPRAPSLNHVTEQRDEAGRLRVRWGICGTHPRGDVEPHSGTQAHRFPLRGHSLATDTGRADITQLESLRKARREQGGRSENLPLDARHPLLTYERFTAGRRPPRRPSITFG
jgi:hypothetical protein